MVRAAIVDSNVIYLERLQDYWSKTYGNSVLIVCVFPDYQQLLKHLKTEKIDIVLIHHQMEADLSLLPERVLKLYLISGKRSGEINGIPALPKNGNADELYNNMMMLYEEHMNIERVTVPGQLIMFTTPVGGSGSTSCAVGFGKSLAYSGKKALYLNLENVGATELFLDASQGETMEKLFYLCKTNRKNLSFSLDKIVGRDSSGLRYVRQCQNPIELQDKTAADLAELITMVTDKGAFDAVIIDKSFGLDETTTKLMQIAQRVVVTTDASAAGKKKLECARALFDELDCRGGAVGRKVYVLCNKAQQAGTDISWGNFLGNIPDFGRLPEKEVADRIGKRDVFEGLLEKA